MGRHDGHDEEADEGIEPTELPVEGPPGGRADEHDEVEAALDRGLEGGDAAEGREDDVCADAAQEVDYLGMDSEGLLVCWLERFWRRLIESELSP